MRFLLLILLPLLLLTIGCSVDTVEDSDADILEPASTDFHFQDFPLPGGNLIPFDEIPYVTIEKTREDNDFYYWQLKADPVPIHEDLVVGVRLGLGVDGATTLSVRPENGGIIVIDPVQLLYTSAVSQVIRRI